MTVMANPRIFRFWLKSQMDSQSSVDVFSVQINDISKKKGGHIILVDFVVVGLLCSVPSGSHCIDSIKDTISSMKYRSDSTVQLSLRGEILVP